MTLPKTSCRWLSIAFKIENMLKSNEVMIFVRGEDVKNNQFMLILHNYYNTYKMHSHL